MDRRRQGGFRIRGVRKPDGSLRTRWLTAEKNLSPHSPICPANGSTRFMAAAHPRRRPRYGFERQPSGTAITNAPAIIRCSCSTSSGSGTLRPRSTATSKAKGSNTPFGETSSPTSRGSSRSCGRHLPRQQHEAFGVTRSSKTTGGVLMTEISPLTGLRRRADNLQPASVAYSDPSGLKNAVTGASLGRTEGLHLENLGSSLCGVTWPGSA